MKLRKLAIVALLSFAAVAGAFSVRAQDNLGSSTPKIPNPLSNPNLAIRIPGLTLRNASCTATGCSVPWLADYIQALYKYGLAVIGIAAVICIMFGGVLWLTAGGNDERVGEARKWIGGSIMGILVASASYLILNLVNPALTNLSPLQLSYTQREELPDISEYQAIIDNNGQLPPPGDIPPAKKNIVTIKVDTATGEKNVQVDESIAELTKKTFKEIKDKGFKIYEVGGYRESKMCHGMGLALDINVKDNYCIDCYGKKGARVGSYYRPAGPGVGNDYSPSATSFPQEIVNIFKKNGWCWGGDWKGFKDYMHFSTPTCRGGVECAAKGPYDFSKSSKANQQNLGITYP